MAANPDPKPGRWVLPLVILGMIAFTYFFVRELPQASPDTTIPTGEGTTTTADNGEEPPTTDPTDNGTEPVDPEVRAYLDEVDEINDELQLLRTELVAANTGFDAEPREVEYGEAVTRFEDVVESTDELVDRFSELEPPEGLVNNHDVMATEIGFALSAADDALAGLTSNDPGTIRRAEVDNFVEAAENFDNEVTILHTTASS